MTPKVRRRDCDPAAQPETAVAPAFPSARYFQIHFEQLYRLIDELSEKIEVATRELALLRARGSRCRARPGSVRGRSPAKHKRRFSKTAVADRDENRNR
jgi:hypothetical protein